MFLSNKATSVDHSLILESIENKDAFFLDINYLHEHKL